VFDDGKKNKDITERFHSVEKGL